MARELGTLDMTKLGQVLSVRHTQKSGELEAVGPDFPTHVLSMLEDAGHLLEPNDKFHRVVVSFPTYDYLITSHSEGVHVSICERES